MQIQAGAGVPERLLPDPVEVATPGGCRPGCPTKQPAGRSGLGEAGQVDVNVCAQGRWKTRVRLRASDLGSSSSCVPYSISAVALTIRCSIVSMLMWRRRRPTRPVAPDQIVV